MATISGKAVLITGANRGIGRALAMEALDRGAGQGIRRYPKSLGRHQ